MGDTKIEWTEKTWNPVTGCTKVSQGCKHCYAESIARRMWATQYAPNADGSPRKFTDVRCHPERLTQPYSWRKPQMVFVNSMSDLFHEDVPWEFVADVFSVMEQTPEHTYQILTKRPERMREFMQGWDEAHAAPPANVWLGTSVEDQANADKRIPILLQTTAAVRFISAEPLLGPVDLRPAFCSYQPPSWGCGPDIDWVIVGGESGRNARPFNPDWARSIRDQCQQAGVAFFMKQMGGYRPGTALEDLPADLRIRQFPQRVTA